MKSKQAPKLTCLNQSLGCRDYLVYSSCHYKAITKGNELEKTVSYLWGRNQWTFCIIIIFLNSLSDEFIIQEDFSSKVIEKTRPEGKSINLMKLETQKEWPSTQRESARPQFVIGCYVSGIWENSDNCIRYLSSELIISLFDVQVRCTVRKMQLCLVLRTWLIISWLPTPNCWWYSQRTTTWNRNELSGSVWSFSMVETFTWTFIPTYDGQCN